MERLWCRNGHIGEMIPAYRTMTSQSARNKFWSLRSCMKQVRDRQAKKTGLLLEKNELKPSVNKDYKVTDSEKILGPLTMGLLRAIKGEKNFQQRLFGV